MAQESKEIKDKAVSVINILNTMAELEEFNGLTVQRIYENWYNLKKQLNLLLAEEEKKDA